ncbi:copper resistance protein CopC [Saccharothrix longispora]|uniref:copper resistance CopC family protein n=1 Tax=Saccharothrix longispora TaxID=33920 RepID=UPI0028FD23E8|nr:copper resistance protein CopC [Saccharothrix longispora]MDU0292223.1 copper resistance protein CopC [Saccharothrix longispora]
MTRLALSALLAALALFGVAPPAWAHTELVSSDPANGSAPAQRPTQLTLTFTEPVPAESATITITGPDGSAWPMGEVAAQGSTLTVPLKDSGSPAGQYAVSWLVQSLDGDFVDGTFAFTLPAPAQPPAATGTASGVPGTTAPSAPAETTTAPPASTTGQVTPTTGGETGEPTGATRSAVPVAGDDGDGGGVPVWVWIALAVILVGLGIAIAAGRRKGGEGARGAGDPVPPAGPTGAGAAGAAPTQVLPAAGTPTEQLVDPTAPTEQLPAQNPDPAQDPDRPTQRLTGEAPDDRPGPMGNATGKP